MEYRLPVKIRAMLDRKPTEQGYPMTGIVNTPEGLYLGMVNGFIPKPPPKPKGRPATPDAKMLRYCRFLAEWGNPGTNPQLLESEKAEARRRAFNTTADDRGHDALQRKSRRDEVTCRGWLEVLIHEGGAVLEVLVFPDLPKVGAATSAIRIIGEGWRYKGGAVTYGELVLTIDASDPEALRQRIEREPQILCLPGKPPDI